MSTADDYYAGKATGQLISFIFKLVWLSLIYSPFVFIGGYTYVTTSSKLSTHWSVSLIAGLVAAFLLYMLIAFLEGMTQAKKQNSSKIWLALRGINIVLVCGLPFLVGGSIAVDVIGKKELSSIEYWIVFVFTGLILASIAYTGVIGKLNANKSFQEN